MATTIDTTVTEELSQTKRLRKFSGTKRGLEIKRYFSTDGTHPFDKLDWEMRDAVIGDAKGNVVFEQKNVEIPTPWSLTATNVVVSKYFRGKLGTAGRETSVKQLINRVVDSISDWGIAQGYFVTKKDGEIFRAEMKHLVVNQKVAFNSPVWFNVGVEERPQASACFINSVDDTMESILGLAKTEGMLFKWGSGAGSNLSTIRSSREFLSKGGTASGPVSFMRGYDAFAGVIKSGGKTRRAAKMVILDVKHPDIEEFINCKSLEEQKAWALIDAGYDGGFNVPGGAYDSVFFQNANHSIRVNDEFMQAVVDGGTWTTSAIVGGEDVDTYDARDLMQQIAEATHLCGDPGMQYDTTINDWHTCPNTDRIHASNPCSEYMFLNDSACNLASLNLMKFRDADGEFDTEAFRAAVRLTITAQEILVDNASYPTPQIEKNSHAFRPLGLGYANLGALLMAKGLPYDSAEGHAYAGAITAVMCGEAYSQSARLAETVGPFSGYALNEKPMLNVVEKHGRAVENIPKYFTAIRQTPLFEAAKETWAEAIDLGRKFGYRNAQVTVLAPTGTIGFMMDCDTTGIEPDIALIKYKKLVGGGFFKIVNQTVPEALTQLGYSELERNEIIDYLMENDTIEGAPHLQDSDLPVFDCAFKPANGTRSIVPMGHALMMGAAQPFLSGAISKTVNMPSSATVEEIAEVYIDAWKLGLKAIAIYRDGCKRTQPLSTSLDAEVKAKAEATNPVVPSMEQVHALAKENGYVQRKRLGNERDSITHKFSIAGHEGYITVGKYADTGRPGEIFITMSKEGSVVSGLMDAFATSISMCLQYGVPLEVLVDKFAHTRFEPSGYTNNPRIRVAKSVTDYIFRWLADKFLDEDTKALYLNMETDAWRPGSEKAAPGTKININFPTIEEAEEPSFADAKTGDVIYESKGDVFTLQADAPPCTVCGSITVRSGACYKCQNCGSTSGCS